MRTRELEDDDESYEDDIRDIQDILDDASLDEAEKLDAITEVVAPDDDLDDGSEV